VPKLQKLTNVNSLSAKTMRCLKAKPQESPI